jgi:energy-coupling factor transporter ATP-binding protein EcfA2
MAAITGIYIDGFKSFAPVEGEPKPAAEQFASLKPGEPQVLTGWYPIKPLTVLAGANSSGKSTFLQALLLLKQTYDAVADPGPLRLSGPHVNVGGSLGLVHRTATKFDSAGRLGFGIEMGASGAVRSDFAVEPSGTVALRRSIMGGLFSSRQPWELLPDQLLDPGSIVERIDDASSRESCRRAVGLLTAKGISFRSINDRAFLRVGAKVGVQESPQRTIEEFGPAFEPLMFEVFRHTSTFFAGFMKSSLASLLHLPGITATTPRGNTIGEPDGTAFPGLFTDYHARMLADWTTSGDERLALVEKWLKDLGMTSKLVARVQGGAYVEIFVGRTLERPKNKKNDLVSVADVGDGVAQVLPILVALAAATEHNTLVIQQPELHLHPRAQAQLAEIICDVIKEKRCTVLIETHSDVFLRRLRSVIAEAELPANDAVFHWFKRDEKSGATTVTTVIPDEQGRSGEWPVDFADVQLEEQKRYIKATQLHAVGRKAA